MGMEGSVYLKARQEWDERYADLVLGKRNWQITAAGMMAITMVLAFGMVRLWVLRPRMVHPRLDHDRAPEPGFEQIARAGNLLGSARHGHKPIGPQNQLPIVRLEAQARDVTVAHGVERIGQAQNGR